MESLLIAGSLTSLLLGAAMSAFAWHIIRTNRRREGARIQLLGAQAFPDEIALPAMVPAIERFDNDEFRSEEAEDDMPAVAPADTLFAEPPNSGARARRTHSFAAVAVVVTVAISMYAWVHSVSAPSEPAAAAVTPAAPREQRVELLALKHDRTSTSFVVSGRLRNPGDAGPLRDLIAVVEVFGRDGRELATVRAPIARTFLESGESSEFSVAAPDARDVARYRVEFQIKGAGPVAHIDLRAN